MKEGMGWNGKIAVSTSLIQTWQGSRQEKRYVKSGIISWKSITIWISERRAWSMSLKEMHEQQKSPREQLQELNKKSRIELENSLLKEALALSSENCEELMKQSNQEQARAEQNRQRDAEQSRKLIRELQQSVKQYQDSSEQLRNAISTAVGNLADDVGENTINAVREALMANDKGIRGATAALVEQTNQLITVMQRKVDELEKTKNSFFQFEGKKLYLFWGGMICNIITLILLVWVIVFR